MGVYVDGQVGRSVGRCMCVRDVDLSHAICVNKTSICIPHRLSGEMLGP